MRIFLAIALAVGLFVAAGCSCKSAACSPCAKPAPAPVCSPCGF